MAMLASDLEQLEQHLDGALEAAAVSQLQDRLKTDSELAATLAELKAQRAVRSAVWQSIDPDAVSSDRMVWRIRGAMLAADQKVAIEPKRQWSSWRIASLSSAAAACMVLGFLFGRIGHNQSQFPTGGSPVIASNENHGSTLIGLKSTAPDAAPTQLVNNTKPKYSVPITNEYGEVVAWQTFDNPDQAKNFTEDLHRTHAQPTAPAAAGQTRLVDHQEQY